MFVVRSFEKKKFALPIEKGQQSSPFLKEGNNIDLELLELY